MVWEDFFISAKGKEDSALRGSAIANWQQAGQSWAGESKIAGATGFASLVAKFQLKGMTERAQATAGLARTKAEKAAELAVPAPSTSGFKKDEGRSLSEEVAFRFSEAANAWDKAAAATAAAAAGGWTAEGARDVAVAARRTAGIAVAADLGEIVESWKIAAAAWQFAFEELQQKEGGPATVEDGKAEALSVENSASSCIMALMGVFAGWATTFCVLRLRRSALNQGAESLLAA